MRFYVEVTEGNLQEAKTSRQPSDILYCIIRSCNSPERQAKSSRKNQIGTNSEQHAREWRKA